MDFKRKLELVEQSILMISRADDADAAMRSAALDHIDALIGRERSAIADRVAAQITATIGQPPKAKETT